MGRSVSSPRGALWVLYAAVPEAAEDEYPADAFDDMVDGMRRDLTESWPSLYDSDRWVDREDRVIAENRLGAFGVSEYCGLLAFWFLPNDDAPRGLAERWGESVRDGAASILASYAERLERLGTMSNGEGVYRRAA